MPQCTVSMNTTQATNKTKMTQYTLFNKNKVCKHINVYSQIVLITRKIKLFVNFNIADIYEQFRNNARLELHQALRIFVYSSYSRALNVGLEIIKDKCEAQT